MVETVIHNVSGREALRRTGGGLVHFAEVTTTYCPRSDVDALEASAPRPRSRARQDRGAPAARIEWSSEVPWDLAVPRAAVNTSRPEAYSFLCLDGVALLDHFAEKWNAVPALRESLHTGVVNGLTVGTLTTVTMAALQGAGGLVTGAVAGGIAASTGVSGLAGARVVIIGTVTGAIKGSMKGALCGGNVIAGCIIGGLIGIMAGAGQYLALRRAKQLDAIVESVICLVLSVAQQRITYLAGLAMLERTRAAAEPLLGPYDIRENMPAFRAIEEARHVFADAAALQALVERRSLPPRAAP